MGYGNDMIQIDGGNLEVFDMVSQGYFYPKMDPEQNLTYEFRSLGNGMLEATIRRPLETEDAENDYVLQAGRSVYMGWVIRTTDAILTSKHDKGGSLMVDIPEAVEAVVDEPETEESADLTVEGDQKGEEIDVDQEKDDELVD